MSSQTMPSSNTAALIQTPSSPNILTAMLVTTAAMLILVLLHKIAAFRKREKCLPPGPASLPFIGNMHQLLWNKPMVVRWIHRLLDEMGTNMMSLKLGSIHVIFVTCPVIAREVIRKKEAVFFSRPATFASNLFSYGYKIASLTTLEDQWKKMKRVLTSEVLSPAMEYQFHGQREEEADELVRYVYNQVYMAPEGCVNVRHIARYFCGNIIRRLVFGDRYFNKSSATSVAGHGADEEEHIDALFTLVNYVYNFCVSDYYPALVGLDLDGNEQVAKGVIRTLDGLHGPVIEERVHMRSKRQKDSGNTSGFLDILDVLVSLQDADGQPLLSIDEIKAQTVELMFASVVYPSNTVEWALAEMINKPEVMQKAVDELDIVVGKERLVQESDICKLYYLKSCIREAFRLHPYHAINPPRVAMEDTTLGGYKIPKDSHVIISRIGLGKNPNVWPEPLEFRPERHLTGEVVHLTEPDLRFITFSTGRRGCPGVSLGTSFTMVLFARLLQGFSWTKPPNVDKIDLQESPTSLALTKSLVLQAKPRLAADLYVAH